MQFRRHPALLAVAAAATLVLAGGARAPAGPGEPIALEDYARPGRLVPAPDGGRLNIRCIGRGAPTVVLTAGAGEQSLTWRELQGRLAATNRVCAWDRPGFGFSDPSPRALDTDRLADDLDAALKGAGIAPPYLLVGHSLGSFETLMLAFRHPERLAGIVLIDPSGPFQDVRLKAAAPAAYAIVDSFQEAQLAALKQCVEKMAAGAAAEGCTSPRDEAYPTALNQALAGREGSPAGRKAMLSLLGEMFSGADSRQLQRAWRPLGAVPIVVLTAGNPPPIPAEGEAGAQLPAMQEAWSAMHEEMARLSSRGEHRIVAGAGHYIYKDRPEAVIEAIRQVGRAHRGKAGRSEGE